MASREGISAKALGLAATAATLVPVTLVVVGSSLAFDRLIPRPVDVPILIMITMVAMAVAGLAVALAVPLHWLLGRFGLRGPLRIIVGGAIAALPASAIWLGIQTLSNDPLSRFITEFWPVTILIPGLVGSSVYWFLERQSGAMAN